MMFLIVNKKRAVIQLFEQPPNQPIKMMKGLFFKTGDIQSKLNLLLLSPAYLHQNPAFRVNLLKAAGFRSPAAKVSKLEN